MPAMTDFAMIDPQNDYRMDVMLGLDEIYRMVSDYQLQKNKSHAPRLLEIYKLKQNDIYRDLLKKYGTNCTNRNYDIFVHYNFDDETKLREISAYKKNWKNFFMDEKQQCHYLWYCFNHQMASLQSQLKQKDATIDDLDERLIDCQVSISDLEQQVETLTVENDRLLFDVIKMRGILTDAGLIEMPAPVYNYLSIAARIDPFKQELLTVTKWFNKRGSCCSDA